jgi:hypothetical protein
MMRAFSKHLGGKTFIRDPLFTATWTKSAWRALTLQGALLHSKSVMIFSASA